MSLYSQTNYDNFEPTLSSLPLHVQVFHIVIFSVFVVTSETSV